MTVRSQALEVVRKVRRVEGQVTKWKLITVELGTNDVCSYNCGVRGFFKDTSPAAFKVSQVLAEAGHYLIEMSAEEHDGNAGGSLHPAPDHCPPPHTHGRLTVR